MAYRANYAIYIYNKHASKIYRYTGNMVCCCYIHVVRGITCNIRL